MIGDGGRFALLVNIVGDEALSVRIGDRVVATFEDRGGGAMLPQFHRVNA